MESVKVKDHMSHRPVYFKANQSVVSAVEKLLQSKSSGAPVVNDSMEILGFISEQDCLKAMLSSSYHSGEVSTSVEEVMSAAILTVKPYDSVLSVAENMSGTKPRVYPVINDDGKLVGVINRTHILNALDKEMHELYDHAHHFI